MTPLLMDNQIPNFLPNGSPLSCLVQNAQGAGKREFQITLKEILRINRPSIVVLLETHQDGVCAQQLAKFIGYQGLTIEEANGHS